MQIEEGKCYWDRRGKCVGPMRRSGCSTFPWTSGVLTYRDDGTVSASRYDQSELDLIEEVPSAARQPEPPQPNEPKALPAPDPEPPAVVGDPMYGSLAGILQAAHDQAARGKGHDRHADDKPFLNQPIMEIARMLGDTGGHAYQIMKKAQEANRMVRRAQYDAAVQEYLGVINYAAAAILLIREL